MFCLRDLGEISISFRAQIYFLAVIHLLDITYLSLFLNQSENPCKIIKYGPRVQRLGNTPGTYYERQDGVYTY